MTAEVVPVSQYELARSQTAARYDDPSIIATIKQTVAKGATDAQLRMFLEVCKRTGLDPFLKEIFFVAETGVIMAARDGYLRVANEHPMFDGMETRVERDDKGIPIKAVCSVWRKDRTHPITCEAYFNEYVKGSKVWQQYKSAMIAKVAEVLSLKRSFAINGVVSEEEISETPSGSKEAANEIAQKKLSGEIPLTGTTTAQLSPEDEERIEQHKALLKAITEALITVYPEPTGKHKDARQVVLSQAFGLEKFSWKVIECLPNDQLEAGLQKVHELLTPDEPEVKVIWIDKFDCLDDFKRIKKSLISMSGSAGEAEYYRVLKQHGVEKSNEFGDNLVKAMRCFNALKEVEKLMHSLKQPEQVSE